MTAPDSFILPGFHRSSRVLAQIQRYTSTSAAGTGMPALRAALADRVSGLRPNDFEDCDLATWIGRVPGLEDLPLPERLAHLESRNNRLAWLGLQQDGMFDAVRAAAERLGPERIGIVMGTSTSSIGFTEAGYRHLDENDRMPPAWQAPEVQNLHGPGLLVAAATGLQGPCLTISTACSSSAKVFATAARWMQCGLVDAVLVGGVDSLCLNTLYGFNSLQLLSPEPCRPSSADRQGINIGEAAGYALVGRPGVFDDADLALLGYGESSDAWHMSHPHPEGKGALASMDQALQRAGLAPDAIGYVNLHGTASKANDAVENVAIAQRFGASTRIGSTKGWTGHTLGAAGILEAVIALDALAGGRVPGTLNTDEVDPAFEFPVQLANFDAPLRYVMSNSFGFGGNNATLVFGRNDD
jgi:3-oxoacyl-[acyl-carrier-protein] synthase-1